MNPIQTLHTQYIRYANRSLETVEVKQSNKNVKIFWVYNYEGKHFRVFESEAQAQAFLGNKRMGSLIDFESEAELDVFLENY